MKRSICLSAVALCLAAFSASEAIAQHCQPYWTAEYKCMNGCGCPGGGVAPPQPAGPSLEVLALQRARARMVAVIESVSSSLPFFDRNAASDAMYTEEARFLADAVQSWIWANTKKFVLNQIKVELKMQDYFKQHTDLARSPFLDIDEAHVLQYYDQRKFNIMNLPDGIEQAVGLKKLRDSVVTLQTQAQGYALEAATIAARGTEAEAQAYAGEMYRGMDADSKSIVKTNMGLMNLPEPFASLATHYFTTTDQ